jgi:glycosyltransferase involved in cell wall biosynthesis
MGVTDVVVPQMTAVHAAHTNLYWLALLLAPARVLVLAGDEPVRVFDRSAFRRFALRQAFGSPLEAPRVDALRLLWLLLRAGLTPRRTAAAAASAPGPRLRVLHVISSLGVGGAQRQLAELVNRTPPDRFDVEVLVLGRADGEFSRAWLARDDVRVTFLRSWPLMGAAVREVQQHCARGRFDIVHTWLFMANAIGVAGARLAGVPRVIASVRNLSLWKRTWYRQWWFRPADVLLSRAADVVTVNATALVPDHAAWAHLPASRIQVIHNGLDPSGFLREAGDARQAVRDAAGLPADALVVGTTGRLAPEKDHQTFLRIVRNLRRLRPSVRGVIVGDGALRDALEAEAARVGVEGSVVFLGERRDARRLMAGFDLFVLPSAIEGFPNVLLEAAFLGVPSIASRVGGSADVLPGDGVSFDATFDVGDDGRATEEALRLLDDRAAGADHAARTRGRALEFFTADRMASAWLSLYTRCPSEENVQ